MYWANFLHIYQPTDQSEEILERVVNESYRRVFNGFLKIKNLKINLNINGALTELLVKRGYTDVIKAIYQLAKSKRLEFTESAKYHPFLPFLTNKEIERQIRENNKINKKYFGSFYQPQCFFPPELAFTPKIGKIVAKLGYKILILDEIAYPGESSFIKEKIFKLKGENLILAFRERRVSNCLMSALIKDEKEFKEILGEDLKKEIYLLTGIDGETFGHHRPGLEKSLFKIVSSREPKQIFLSEIPKYIKMDGEILPRASTWASSLDDIQKGLQFYSWRNPKNKIHKLQWQFLNYLRSLIRKRRVSKKIIQKYDEALASDQFFWASAEPWWSIEMIEKGAFKMLKVLKSISKNKKEAKIGENFYHQIISTAFEWQRTGEIEKKSKKYREAVKIPFKERTLEIGGKEVYKTILSLMKRKISEAIKRKNFEKAILWRDAIWKLETKNDIYDLVHAVDLLRIELPEEFKKLDPKLNELFFKYKEKYKKIESGQPEMRRV
jgi:hypothetical protein